MIEAVFLYVGLSAWQVQAISNYMLHDHFRSKRRMQTLRLDTHP